MKTSIVIATLILMAGVAEAAEKKAFNLSRTPVRSCAEVTQVCAAHCAHVRPGQQPACQKGCPRALAAQNNVSCVDTTASAPATFASCGDVANFCQQKCTATPEMFRNGCLQACPVSVAQRSRRSCNWPPDGVANGRVYGPPAAGSCAEVASICNGVCASSPGAPRECVGLCSRQYAERSHLKCSL